MSAPEHPAGSPTHPAQLSQAEAAARLAQNGFNELSSDRPSRWWAPLVGVFSEPMFLLLVAGAGVYFLLGDHQEALMLMGSVILIMMITLYQEQRSEQALSALKEIASPRALVLRDGERKRIAGRDVVPGDVVILAEGDRVPADGMLLESFDLAIDESLLSGESLPVAKHASPEATAWWHTTTISNPTLPRPGAAGTAGVVFSGTLVTQGQGMIRILATGSQTEMGRIGASLNAFDIERTPLQQTLGRLTGVLALYALALGVMVVTLYGTFRQNWLEGVLAGITLSMSTIPEEVPVVLTVFMALGAWRISKKGVLARRVPAIEALGATTVLCVDKTGTLTLNRMAVQALWAAPSCQWQAGSEAPLPDILTPLAQTAVLACEITPTDPMEQAIHQLASRLPPEALTVGQTGSLVHEYPLCPDLLAMTHIWQAAPTDETYTVATKGSPEAILSLCELSPEVQAAVSQQLDAMAQQGLRLLGVAQARLTKQETDPWPPSPREIPFQWLGLLALADPIRPQVPEAIAQCVQAGIRVVMITGDHPQTAAGIARQIGLDSPGGILTGADLATLSGDSLSQRLEGVNLFARVLPEQKLTIVTALKARGEVVAMTGDGVNDAPALKAAHIGVAMGARGTDVAREASALVLLEDDFSAMVSAIRLGRRIYDNIQKALHFIISVHLPIVALSLLPVVFHWPLILLPMHIVFLELIIDPACSIVFEAEPEEADVMSRPPRPVTAAVLDRPALGLSLLQGGMIMLGVIALLVGGLQQQMAQETLRSMAFTTLVFSNLLLVVENRSWTQSLRQLIAHPNPALGWMTGVTLALLGLIFAVPWLRQGFQLAPLSLEQVGLCIGLSIVSVLWFEGFKAWAHRRTPAGG